MKQLAVHSAHSLFLAFFSNSSMYTQVIRHECINEKLSECRNRVVFLPKPNQVVFLPKPYQEVVLPKPNQVVFLPKPNQEVVLPKPSQEVSLTET